jgi:predicted transglutaminase-like cysteine proteinase
MTRPLWIALAWIMSMTSPSSAGPRLLGSADAPPLPGWVKFCDRHPAECTVDVFQPESLTLTQELYALLSSVDLTVNRSVKPMTDEDQWGVADLWSYPNDGYGDCEDYQLLKRKLLIEAGLPRRALLMTVVIDEKGNGHAVLTVRTDRGDLILDNRTNVVLEWPETNYTFVKRESAKKPGWVSLAPEPIGTLIVSADK